MDSHGKQEKICVWSKPWENNFMSLTTLDGRNVIEGGIIDSNEDGDDLE